MVLNDPKKILVIATRTNNFYGPGGRGVGGSFKAIRPMWVISGTIAHRFFDQIIRTCWKKLMSLKNGFSIFSYKYGLVRPFEMVL